MVSNLAYGSQHLEAIFHAVYPIVAVLLLFFLKCFYTRHYLVGDRFKKLTLKIDTLLKLLETPVLEGDLKLHLKRQLELLSYELSTGLALQDYNMLALALHKIKVCDREDLRIKKSLFPLLSICKGEVHLSKFSFVHVIICFVIALLLFVLAVPVFYLYTQFAAASSWQWGFLAIFSFGFMILWGGLLVGNGIDLCRAFFYFRALKKDLPPGIA